ncbi:MAG: pyridoxamine 5'-phosphate oxidase family protein [Egibacteraceae bacterium]
MDPSTARTLGLKELLCEGQPCVLATVDPTGAAYTTLLSWVTAYDDHTVCLALDARGTALRNLRHTSWVALEILSPKRVLAIRGRARVHQGQIAACPFPSVFVEMDVIEGRDHTGRGTVWYGPSYRYAEGKEHRYVVEQAVLNELRRSV